MVWGSCGYFYTKMTGELKMGKFTYEIKKHIGTLSEADSMSLELNQISYGKAAPKYDLRRWRMTEEGKQLMKGITLNTDEVVALRELLNTMKIE